MGNVDTGPPRYWGSSGGCWGFGALSVPKGRAKAFVEQAEQCAERSELVEVPAEERTGNQQSQGPGPCW